MLVQDLGKTFICKTRTIIVHIELVNILSFSQFMDNFKEGNTEEESAQYQKLLSYSPE